MDSQFIKIFPTKSLVQGYLLSFVDEVGISLVLIQQSNHNAMLNLTS